MNLVSKHSPVGNEGDCYIVGRFRQCEPGTGTDSCGEPSEHRAASISEMTKAEHHFLSQLFPGLTFRSGDRSGAPWTGLFQNVFHSCMEPSPVQLAPHQGSGDRPVVSILSEARGSPELSGQRPAPINHKARCVLDLLFLSPVHSVGWADKSRHRWLTYLLYISYCNIILKV